MSARFRATDFCAGGAVVHQVEHSKQIFAGDGSIVSALERVMHGEVRLRGSESGTVSIDLVKGMDVSIAHVIAPHRAWEMMSTDVHGPSAISVRSGTHLLFPRSRLEATYGSGAGRFNRWSEHLMSTLVDDRSR